MGNFTDLKKRVLECNLELPRHKLVKFTFGNGSAIDRDAGVVAIKPSGVAYETLTAGDIVLVDLENKIVDGKLCPSSDTRTHVVLYNNFPEIGGIVHTHAAYSVAWAQARKPIPVFGTTHADHVSIPVPCTAIMNDTRVKGDYETETGYQILETFKYLSYREVEMVLVAGHGPFTWGMTPEKAVYNAVVLEELARMAMYTLLINPDAGELPASIIKKHYDRKHGDNAYYGQNEGKQKK
ncbi:MAG: L-ribulose-5-phosphate 4-epimerase AraD [Spirochaetales bacterium]|nr:L-ribulose-5-phosphate 4-epimerase AraD [Spirochaetales bacterium]